MKKRAFTLIELLLPVLRRVRNHGRAAVCLSNLHQFGVVFRLYTDDNDGQWFMAQEDLGIVQWAGATHHLWGSGAEVASCPMATVFEGYPTSAFSAICDDRGLMAQTPSGTLVYGPLSYGFNNWVYKPSARGAQASLAPQSWGVADVKGAWNIPVLFDCCYHESYPNHMTGPPDYEFGTFYQVTYPMCINRHAYGIHVLFMDGSVRKVGLKALWTFKWHRAFDTSGPWTKAGGMQPEDWPRWMRKFKDY